MYEKNPNSKFIRFIDRYWPQIIGLGGLIVLWDALSIVVDNVILPITSRIKNDDWLVQIVLILLTVVVYVVRWEKLEKEKALFSNRLVNLAFVFAAFVFNLLAIVLKLLTEDPRYKIIFGDSNLKKWVNDFMDRYIREQLSSAPFESNAVKSIYLVRQISSRTWDKKLSEYIKRVKETIDPLEWLFRLVKYESDGSMRWNYDFINGVGIESYDFIRYANTILGDFVSDELRTDLLQLSQKPSNKKIDVNEHPFFKQALEWWKKRIKRI